MTGKTVCELGEDVCRRRRNQKKVRAIRQFDVAGAPIFFFIEKTRHHWILGKRLQSERRDEFGRVVTHDGKNLVTLLHEQTREFGGFVSGDRAGDAKNDCFAGAAQAYHFAHSSFFRSPIGILSHARIDNYFWIKRRLKYRSAFMMCRNFCKSSSVVRLMTV